MFYVHEESLHNGMLWLRFFESLALILMFGIDLDIFCSLHIRFS